MYGDRNDGQVEVVEHHRDVVVEASSRMKMEAEGPTADQGNCRYLCQPDGTKEGIWVQSECKHKHSHQH